MLDGGQIPPEIGNLTALTFLDLSFGRLQGSIPSTLGQLTALTALHLGFAPQCNPFNWYYASWSKRNQLVSALPASILALPALTTLDVLGNIFEAPLPYGSLHTASV